MNQGYKAATGVEVKPRRRPDVTVVKEDGTVHAIEVKSNTDVRSELIRRNQEAMNQLPPEIRGKVKVVDYTQGSDVSTKGGQ